MSNQKPAQLTALFAGAAHNQQTAVESCSEGYLDQNQEGWKAQGQV